MTRAFAVEEDTKLEELSEFVGIELTCAMLGCIDEEIKSVGVGRDKAAPCFITFCQDLDLDIRTLKSRNMTSCISRRLDLVDMVDLVGLVDLVDMAGLVDLVQPLAWLFAWILAWLLTL